MDSLLEIKNISKHFNGVKALDQFSASIEGNSITGLIGPNGAGKTTLFDIISRFIDPDDGEVLFNGVSLLRRGPHQLRELGIARTFQITKLFYTLTVRENLLLALRQKEDNCLFRAILRGTNGVASQNHDLESSNEVINQLGLSGILYKKASQLSGGQAKLVSLACALVSRPRLLFLDEPVASVDHANVERMFGLLQEWVQKRQLTVLIIEHKLTALSTLCNKLIVMHEGRKILEGPPESIHRDDRLLSVYTGV